MILDNLLKKNNVNFKKGENYPEELEKIGIPHGQEIYVLIEIRTILDVNKILSDNIINQLILLGYQVYQTNDIQNILGILNYYGISNKSNKRNRRVRGYRNSGRPTK